MKERPIQNACIDLLRIHGFEVIRVNSGMIRVEDEKRGSRRIRMAQRGTSDIIACSPRGEFVALEIKAPGNKPTEYQMDFLQRVDDCKGIALWTDSVEWLEKWLKDNNYKKW